MNKKILIFLLMMSIFIFNSLSISVNAQELSVNRDYYSYRVVSGDTLSSIAEKFKTTIAAVKSINGLTSNSIYTGQMLKIPSNSNVAVFYYTVQPGDTLWGISQNTGLSINTIKAINGLSSDYLRVGQPLTITYRNPVTTVNFRAAQGDTVWAISQKYHTSTASIIKSNFMHVDYLMPGEILTIPLNSTQTVKPVGISIVKRKVSSYYGDIYTWENARRLFTVGTDAKIKDVVTGTIWNVRYYGGSNHADIIPLTKTDTDVMYKTFGYKWSWINKRSMVLYFTQGGIKHQLACSLIGMPHSTTNILNNGMVGHCCLYFYNSVGHSNPVIDPIAQANIKKANGQ